MKKLTVFFIILLTITLSACVSRSDNSSNNEVSDKSQSITSEINSQSSQISEENTSSSEIQSSSEESVSESSEPITTAELLANPAIPLLVNVDNPLVPQDYKPELEKIDEYHYLEKGTAKAYWEMVNAALDDGITLWCASGFRGYDLQKRLWDKRYDEYRKNSETDEEAYTKTLEWTAYPGRSEHQTGMCIDFNMVEPEFKDTKAGKWLAENAHIYGFILRYPNDKSEITKTSYEPWHYRYVGIDHAKAIYESGMCLEEYVADLKNNK